MPKITDYVTIAHSSAYLVKALAEMDTSVGEHLPKWQPLGGLAVTNTGSSYAVTQVMVRYDQGEDL